MTAATDRPWSVNRNAAKAVVLNARNTADARQLLDVLGLVDGPEGREVLPDDPRSYDVAFLAAVPGEDPEKAAGYRAGLESRRKQSTVPTGLLHPARPAPAPAPPLELVSPPPSPAEEVPAMPPPVATLRRSPSTSDIAHGTPKGYWKERSLKLVTCDACKQAISKYTAYKKAERDARRWATAQQRAEATVARIEAAAESAAPPPHLLTDVEHLDDQLADWELELLKENGGQAVEIAGPVPTVELDVWFATAASSSSKRVQRAARAASTALLQLHTAMDDLCRAERAISTGSKGVSAP